MRIDMNKRLLQLAWNAIDVNNYVPVDDVSVFNQLVDHNNPEVIYMEIERKNIIKKAYANLSSEAKQVIQIVLDAPNEIMEIIASPRTRLISQKRIESMMRRQWKEKSYTKQVMKELNNFVKNF
jgi:predicted secreted protein